MWHLKFSKRDFVEFWLGAGKKSLDRVQRSSGMEPVDLDDTIRAYWKQEPSTEYHFPDVIVASEAQLNSVLTALNATPMAASPVSAFSRLVTPKDFNEYHVSGSIDLFEHSRAAIAALAMAEAVWHSDGKIGLRQISCAACKRTLSYAWGKAVTMGASGMVFEKLPGRWLEAYSIINVSSSPQQLRRTISGVMGALSAVVSIAFELPPRGEAAQLAYAIHRGDRKVLGNYWKELSGAFSAGSSLESILTATREVRANYLQLALREASSSDDESVIAVCAFIATQVAPGSLEHLDLLRQSGNPAIVFWYALYAALQSPSEILGAQGGLGYRVYRDISFKEDYLSAPIADIGFDELKILERSGIDSFSKNLGHQGEVVVELLPTITSSFTYSSRQSKNARQEVVQPGLLENDPYLSSRVNPAYRDKVDQAINVLSQLSRELGELEDGYPSPVYRRGLRKKP